MALYTATCWSLTSTKKLEGGWLAADITETITSGTAD